MKFYLHLTSELGLDHEHSLGIADEKNNLEDFNFSLLEMKIFHRNSSKD